MSEFASKILVFLLLPLYTNVLSTSEYGISDLITTTVTLLIPLFTLSMNQAVLRFAIDKESNKKQVLGFASRIVLYGIIVLFFCYPIFVNLLGISKEYIILFYLLYVTSAYDGVFSYFARAIGETLHVGISGVIKTTTTIVANIIMLVIFRMGVTGYVMSTVLAHIFSIMYLIISCKTYKDYSFKKSKQKLPIEMLKYSIPLIPNSLSWWLSNYASRYIILFYLGSEMQGIYSVGSKVPAILTTIQSIFINAWQLSAISEYNEPDRDEFFTSIYRLYDCIMVLGASVIMIASRFLSTILFAADYFEAWKAVPFLLISVVFGALSGYVGTVFYASKKSKIMFTSTSIGAIFSLLCCFVMVPQMGIVGASFATALANILIWIIRFIKAKRYVKICINIKNTVTVYIMLLVQAFAYIYLKSTYGYIVSGFILLILVLLYCDVIWDVLGKINNVINNRSKHM